MQPNGRSETERTPLDQAARAGWMYYVGGMTQDQIATELGVSRQRAQRLVSRAMAEGLIHVRVDHPIAECMELERALIQRFDLQLARVAPSAGGGVDPAHAIAPLAASVPGALTWCMVTSPVPPATDATAAAAAADGALLSLAICASISLYWGSCWPAGAELAGSGTARSARRR